MSPPGSSAAPCERSAPLNVATPPLTSPEIVAANASGRLTGEQRRALARDFYREHWRTPAASFGWLAISAVMLRIFFPVVRDILPRLFDAARQGSAPVTFGRFTVSLPLWGLLQWGLLLIAVAYVVVVAVQIKRLIGFLFLQQALLYGRVEAVVGEVRQRNGQAIAIFAGRQVRPWSAETLAGAAQGRYRFYALPRFDWLLSGQRLGDRDRATAEEEALAARYSLQAVNGFDAAALTENRAGRLTPEQARWVRVTAPDIGWRLLVLYGFAIAVGLIGAGVYGREALRLGLTGDRLGTIAACLAWAAAWIYLIVKQFVDHARQRRDADEGQALMYEGPVEKWEGWKYHNSGDSSAWIYRYECGGEHFEVSQAAYRALAAGFVHRVYCTPRSKQLVNIELLLSGYGD